jgi:hypothetical protein
VRHSFYWLNISNRNDYIRFSPMLIFSAGTGKYGFNESSASYLVFRNEGKVEYSRGNVSLGNDYNFQPLSMTLYLRPEYSIGKFFIQPQFILDYYFPAVDKNLTAVFAINAGFLF